MIPATERIVDYVTTYSKLTIAIILIATAVMAFGATDTADPIDTQLGGDSLEQEKLDYITANYGEETFAVTENE